MKEKWWIYQDIQKVFDEVPSDRSRKKIKVYGVGDNKLDT